MSDWLSQDRPLIIGHRGASAFAPENTLAAMALAAEQGADGVEFDVQLSADGCPVVIHDDTVERTTNGRGVVTALTLEQLKRLDTGQGQQIPTLDEVFESFGSSLLYNVELKDWNVRNRGAEAAVAGCIQAHNLARRVLVSSFNPLAVRRAQRQMPAGVLCGLIRQPGLQQYCALVARGQADHPYYQMVDADYMVWARRHNLRVHVWTVDEAAEAQRLARLGVHGIISNKPGFIREQLSVSAASL